MLSDISYSDSFKIMTPSFSKVNKILVFHKGDDSGFLPTCEVKK